MHKHLVKRSVDPVSQPVTVDECKTDLRITNAAEDSLISSLIDDATDYMDVPNGAIGKALITQTWTMEFEHADRMGRIEIPITPVQSLDSIEYFDADNVQQSLDVADFFLFADEDSAVVEVKPDAQWPTTFARRDAIKITFTAGFGDNPEDVPNSIRRAIRLLVTHWFETRTPVIVGTTVSEVPLSVQNLISINRKGWVA